MEFFGSVASAPDLYTTSGLGFGTGGVVSFFSCGMLFLKNFLR
jgi:hypothetical protein